MLYLSVQAADSVWSPCLRLSIWMHSFKTNIVWSCV